MRDTLYEFLVLYEKLSLPGIGTISLQRNSSCVDFTNRQIIPPQIAYSFDPQNDSPSKKLFEWLSLALKISEWEAVKTVNEFSSSFKNELAEKKQVNWDKVGVFKKDPAGSLRLSETTPIGHTGQTVHAEKVIRERAEHTILVGERERSAAEMEEYFAVAPARKNFAWIVALILVVLAIMFIGWYFSEKGFSPSSAGNNAVLKSK